MVYSISSGCTLYIHQFNDIYTQINKFFLFYYIHLRIYFSKKVFFVSDRTINIKLKRCEIEIYGSYFMIQYLTKMLYPSLPKVNKQKIMFYSFCCKLDLVIAYFSQPFNGHDTYNAKVLLKICMHWAYPSQYDIGSAVNH